MTTETASAGTMPAVDQAKMDAFVSKVLGDTTGLMTTTMASIGDRLGLFKDLAAHGPATSAALAQRTAVDERYVREWLSAMASAGYLTYEPASGFFTLPAEHAPVLAQEAGPAFFGGVHEELVALVGVSDRVIDAFKRGGGIPYAAYPESMYEGIERFTAGWFENLLLPVWVAALPEVKAQLEHGIRVADVGCGRGRALIKLAQAFPESRYIGYDLYGPNVDQATANARAAGVADRVTFRQGDVADGLPERYDLITTFDVVHDARDPLGLLRALRHALQPTGTYLCLEVNCAEGLEHNAGPLGALFYGCSVLLCMTLSLAEGGAGLGTMGLPETRLRALAEEAGFRSVRRLPLENPFNSLYEIKP
jgi:2-polyprenyl-3-methyl-5-hydroxy-6-metoxy-1,4-benzoquinol methylase